MAGSGLWTLLRNTQPLGSFISPLTSFSLCPTPTKCKACLIQCGGSLAIQLFFLIYCLCPKSFSTRVSCFLNSKSQAISTKNYSLYFLMYLSPFKQVYRVNRRKAMGIHNIRKTSLGRKSGLIFQTISYQEDNYNSISINIEIPYRLLYGKHSRGAIIPNLRQGVICSKKAYWKK